MNVQIVGAASIQQLKEENPGKWDWFSLFVCNSWMRDVD